jgi:hypothetical protein
VSVRGFQQALGALIASPELCVSLRSGGGDILDGYELTERERLRLETVVRQPGMSVNCTLYRVNRITPLYSMLPHTCMVLGERLTDEASGFWASESTDMQFGPETERFAEFLRLRVSSGELQSPYLLETVDFELAVNALRFAPRLQQLADLRSRHAGEGWELNPLIRVVRFAHDPGVLLEWLAQDRVPPPGLEQGDFYLQLDAGGAELALRAIDPLFGRKLAGLTPGTPVLADSPAQLVALVEAKMVVPARPRQGAIQAA